MTDLYSLVLAAEASVVLAAGVVVGVTAARNPDVVLYSRALVLVGGGLGVAGFATLLAATSATQSVPSVLVVAAAVAYYVAGWRIATDAVDTDRGDVFVGASHDRDGLGFDSEP